MENKESSEMVDEENKALVRLFDGETIPVRCCASHGASWQNRLRTLLK